MVLPQPTAIHYILTHCKTRPTGKVRRVFCFSVVPYPWSHLWGARRCCLSPHVRSVASHMERADKNAQYGHDVLCGLNRMITRKLAEKRVGGALFILAVKGACCAHEDAHASIARGAVSETRTARNWEEVNRMSKQSKRLSSAGSVRHARRRLWLITGLVLAPLMTLGACALGVQPAAAPPSPAPSSEQSAGAKLQDRRNMKLVGQIGGPSYAVAVSGSLAYVAPGRAW